MKKFFLLFTLALAFIACENQLGQTPETDMIHLWPASDSTGLYGYINEKGKMVIPAQFDYAYGFSCGKAKVRFDNFRYAFIDRQGNILHTFAEGEECDDYFYYGCCRLYKVMLTAFGVDAVPVAMIDDNFNILFQAEPSSRYYTRLNPMTKDGLALSNYGYYNKKGEIIFPHKNDSNRYYNCADFCDGIAVYSTWWKDATIHTNYGAFNTKGEFVIDTLYSFLQSVGCNRLVYRLETEGIYPLYGLMDTEGNIITEPFIAKYTDDFGFYGDGGLLPVKADLGGKSGYIDKNGTWIIPAQYDFAYPFYEGVAWVTNVNESWRLIDLKGNVVLALDDVAKQPNEMFHNGLCLIYDFTNKQYMYINKQGEVIYSWCWSKKSSNKQTNVPEKSDPSSFDYDEMMLRLFEGTEYYPLAEQCARNRQKLSESDAE